eukprot:1147995-Pelagomonas_calceolata.AAC.14
MGCVGPGSVGVMYGNPETTSGGNALKFYSSQVLVMLAHLVLVLSAQQAHGLSAPCSCAKLPCHARACSATQGLECAKDQREQASAPNLVGLVTDPPKTCVPVTHRCAWMSARRRTWALSHPPAT